MTVARAAVVVVLALAAGCGSEEDEAGTEPRREAREPATVTKAQFIERVDRACSRAAERWDDPLAVARELSPSPVDTTAPPRVERDADALRGWRALMQGVLDEASRKPQPTEDNALLERYRRAISFALTDLEGEELVLRQEWSSESNVPEVRRLFARARRLAGRYGLEACARLDTSPL